jgi:hypothetical protein
MLVLKVAVLCEPVATASRHSSQPKVVGLIASDATNMMDRHFIMRIP